MFTWTSPCAILASVSPSIKERFGLELQIPFSVDLGCDLLGEEATLGRLQDPIV
jgi:hypothetical protein